MVKHLQQFFLWSLILLFAVSCSHNGNANSITFSNGIHKPKVAFVFLGKEKNSWLENMTVSKCIADGVFFTTDDGESLDRTMLHNKLIDPFVGEYQWIREMKPQAEFFIFVEVVKDEKKELENNWKRYIFPLHKKYNSLVKMKIIDVRSKNPKTILQETFSIDSKAIDLENFATYVTNTVYQERKKLVNEMMQEAMNYITIAKWI